MAIDFKGYGSYKTGQPGLFAGFGKVDITPDYPTGLGGYGNAAARMVEAIAERIYATCIALSDGDETILVYTIDTCAMSQGSQDWLRNTLSSALSIPGEKMFFTATHCHSAPAFYGYPNLQRYLNDLCRWLQEAAQQALLDRAPATVYAGKKQIPGMTFVRHYLLSDGTYYGSNFGNRTGKTVVDYAGKADEMLGLVEFRRELPKKNILMVNWQGHPDRARQIGFSILAPSYVGPLRDTLGLLSGCQVAYFTGADGNQNIDSNIENDKHGLNWREYGVKMGTLIYDAYKELQPVEGSGISTTKCVYNAEVDHTWDYLVEECKKIQELFYAEGSKVATEEAKKFGLTSCYQARAIITRSEFGDSRPVELFAFRVGGVGFTSCDYEMFSQSGTFIKENSPFQMTMVLTGNHGYIPNIDAFNYRCYEADTGYFTPGIAERLAQAQVDLLKELHGKE